MNTRTNTSAVFSLLAVALIAGSAFAAEPTRPAPQKNVETVAPYNPDYNLNGKLETQDIFDFLTGWFAGKSDTDVNRNGIVEGLDVLEYINAWFAGPVGK